MDDLEIHGNSKQEAQVTVMKRQWEFMAMHVKNLKRGAKSIEFETNGGPKKPKFKELQVVMMKVRDKLQKDLTRRKWSRSRK